MSTVTTLENQNEIAIIRVDNPPVNALSQAVRAGIINALEEALGDEGVKAIILICGGSTFFAGADITEFGKPLLEPDLNTVVNSLENSSKLVVAAIHGIALGGGLEVAMGCHFRCALHSAKVGLPEVKLGLLPGAGGTQRLPRLAGVKSALDMMISGNPISAIEAYENGVVDKIIETELLMGALSYIQEMLKENVTPRKTSNLDIASSNISNNFFQDYEKSITRKSRGYIAPLQIVQSVKNAIELPFHEGLKLERVLFEDCMSSPQSESLRHLFFAERMVNKIPGINSAIAARTIESVGIIGAGTMGGGIAMNFVNVGIPVILLETNAEALQRGLDIIRSNYERSMKKGRIAQEQVDECMALLTTTLNYVDLSDADLIIEAVFESMEIKKAVFSELDKACKQGAILATNTSTLDIDEIAAVTTRPEDVIGLHFFSPANVMRLLEVVRCELTSNEVIVTCMKMAKTIHKVAVLVGVCFGFVGNRMIEPYCRETQMLLLEGALPAQVDKALIDWGMAMGPCAVLDLTGIDVSYKIRQERTDLPDDPRYGWAIQDLYEAGRYGQKNGKGFYSYDPETRKAESDAEVLKMIEDKSSSLEINRKTITDDEIIARCIYPLINEAALILEEGIASRPGDIDIIWINGYGFPAHRGGPMFYADTIGLEKIYQKICEYRDEHGALYWTPAPLLERMVKEGKSLADLNKK